METKSLFKAALITVMTFSGSIYANGQNNFQRGLMEVANDIRLAEERNTIVPDTTITYKDVEGVKLNVMVFNPPVDAVRPAPCVVFYFGGAFLVGTPVQFYPHAQYLASRGVVAVVADYRVKVKHGTDPDASVQDGMSVMRWVRAHSEELGIDPNKVAASGHSAGGSIAASVATLTEINDTSDDLSVSAAPDALIVFAGGFDRSPGTRGFNVINRLYGDQWAKFSPLENIRAGFPPTLFFVGTEDQFIPMSEIEAIKTKVAEVGEKIDMRVYQGLDHNFFGYGKNENKYYYETLEEFDKFLISMGWLEGSPTVKQYYKVE